MADDLQMPPGDPPNPGYDISFADFAEIVRSESNRKIIRELLSDWFGYAVQGRGADTLVKTSAGELVDLASLHREIEANTEWQIRMYRVAMAYWHGA
jgi:hypothetical protein